MSKFLGFMAFAGRAVTTLVVFLALFLNTDRGLLNLAWTAVVGILAGFPVAMFFTALAVKAEERGR